MFAEYYDIKQHTKRVKTATNNYINYKLCYDSYEHIQTDRQTARIHVHHVCVGLA